MQMNSAVALRPTFDTAELENGAVARSWPVFHDGSTCKFLLCVLARWKVLLQQQLLQSPASKEEICGQLVALDKVTALLDQKSVEGDVTTILAFLEKPMRR